MKKNILILTAAAALVIGLALTGCPSTTTEEVTVRPATNSSLEAPRQVDLKVAWAGWDYHEAAYYIGAPTEATAKASGTSYQTDRITISNPTGTSPTGAVPAGKGTVPNPANFSKTHVAFSFQASPSENDYDITYKFYVRQRGSNTFYEIINTPATGTPNPLSYVVVPQFFPQAPEIGVSGNPGNVFYPSALYPELFPEYNSTSMAPVGGTVTASPAHQLTTRNVKLFNGVKIPPSITINGSTITAATKQTTNLQPDFSTGPGSAITTDGTPSGNAYINTLLNSYEPLSYEIRKVATTQEQYYNPRTTHASPFTALAYNEQPRDEDPEVPNIDEGANQNAYPRQGIYVFFKTPEYVDAVQDGNQKVLRLVANAPRSGDNDLPTIDKDLPRSEFTYTIIVSEDNLVGNGTGTKPFDLSPFASGEEYEFGVQAILNADQYRQQTMKIDPSPIEWAGETWTRP